MCVCVCVCVCVCACVCENYSYKATSESTSVSPNGTSGLISQSWLGLNTFYWLKRHPTDTKISILKKLYSRNQQKSFFFLFSFPFYIFSLHLLFSSFSTLDNFYQPFYPLIHQLFLCLPILDTSDLWLSNSFGLLYVVMVNFSSIHILQ